MTDGTWAGLLAEAAMSDEEFTQTEAPLDAEEQEAERSEMVEEPDLDAEEASLDDPETATDMSDVTVGIVDDKGLLQKVLDDDNDHDIEIMNQDDGTPVELESVR
jgi:hypothetical protein